MKVLLISLIALFLAACNDLAGTDSGAGSSPSATETAPVVNSIDEEKLISANIQSPYDNTAVSAASYAISANSRLLIRFAELRGQAGSILDDQPMMLRLQIADTDFVGAKKSLSICPLTKNWMMYATWDKASPTKHGEWSSPGGDIDFNNCVTAMVTTNAVFKATEEKDFCSDPNAVCFDLTSYIKNYIKIRNVDDGIAIVSSDGSSVQIYGRSTAQGPLLFWRKLMY